MLLEINQSKTNNESAIKSDQCPVTISDYTSQKIMCKILQEQYPNDLAEVEEDSFIMSSHEMKGHIEQVIRNVSNALPEYG